MREREREREREVCVDYVILTGNGTWQRNYNQKESGEKKEKEITKCGSKFYLKNTFGNTDLQKYFIRMYEKSLTFKYLPL